jgi:hypothetical protein
MREVASQVQSLCTKAAILKVRNFWVSRISKSLIQGWMQILPSLLAGLKAVCATFPTRERGAAAISRFPTSAFRLSRCFSCKARRLAVGAILAFLQPALIRPEANEADMQPCFERMETLLTGPPLQQAFGRLGSRTLIAWDGRQYFCSQKLGCPNCLTRERSNGTSENNRCLL